VVMLFLAVRNHDQNGKGLSQRCWPLLPSQQRWGSSSSIPRLPSLVCVVTRAPSPRPGQQDSVPVVQGGGRGGDRVANGEMDGMHQPSRPSEAAQSQAARGRGLSCPQGCSWGTGRGRLHRLAGTTAPGGCSWISEGEMKLSLLE